MPWMPCTPRTKTYPLASTVLQAQGTDKMAIVCTPLFGSSHPRPMLIHPFLHSRVVHRSHPIQAAPQCSGRARGPGPAGAACSGTQGRGAGAAARGSIQLAGEAGSLARSLCTQHSRVS